MNGIREEKAMEYFVRYAGSCLKVWNKIVGQEITHKGSGTGIVVGIDNDPPGHLKGEICVDAQFPCWRQPQKFDAEHLPQVISRLTLPREIEKDLELRYWDVEKAELLNQLQYVVLECSIDESIHETFESIIDWLRRMHRHRAFSEETIQQIRKYRRQFNDRIRFEDLSKTAMNPSVMAFFSLKELDQLDIKLVIKWWRRDSVCNDKWSLINDYGMDWELGRLLSARSAEKVAAEFYGNYGKKIRDISITQTDEKIRSDWRIYDLDVDGLPVDVKNSRKAQNCENRYSEYCIPRFKLDRKNLNVTIAGVFSPCLKPYEILESTEYPKNSNVQFLGETTRAKHAKLKREFNSLVDFSSVSPESKSFLPPWVFDYPEYVYVEQNRARKDLKNFPNLDLLKKAKFEFNLFPVCIVAGIDFADVREDVSLSDWERGFLEQLRYRINRHGLSLPFVFLTVLAHFLDMAASSKSDSNFNPDKYRRFLFWEDANRPLGIYDPLNTIDALIKALGTLWTADSGLIRKFQVFKLRSFNILQGKSDPNDSLWTTLIAYCGGHLKSNGSACGKNPLVLGESKLCDHRRLICPECGYCCPSCKSRIDG